MGPKFKNKNIIFEGEGYYLTIDYDDRSVIIRNTKDFASDMKISFEDFNHIDDYVREQPITEGN